MPIQLSDFKVNDLTAERREYAFAPPKALAGVLDSLCPNPVDKPMAYLVFNVSVTVLPAALALYLLPLPSPYFAVASVAYLFMVYYMWALRFILTLHYASHRSAFQVGAGADGGLLSRLATTAANSYIPVVLCPFFGIPSGSYYLHHVVMHHTENNVLPYDVSSTQAYQRDSVFSFLHYWARFATAALIELPIYAFLRSRYDLLARFLAVLATFLATVVFLGRINPSATFVVFGLPYLVSSFLLMFGNFSQHIFVDPKRHTNSYALTYNLIDSPENPYSYNDGYHIVHHVNSRLHWSAMPAHFLKTLAVHGSNDAFAFRGLTFMDVGFMVMTGQLKKLSKYFVEYGHGQPARSEEELVAEFKRRLLPIPVDTPVEKASKKVQ